MEAHTVQQVSVEEEQQEVIYLVVDENQQGHQVTQIVSDGQLLGQQAQIIMQDGKQAVIITEGSEQQVVLLDEEVSPEAVQSALQHGAVQQQVVTQQQAAPAAPQEVVVQSSMPSTSMNGNQQMQYIINERGQIIMRANPSPAPVQQPNVAQHQLIVTSAGLVRIDGSRSRTETPQTKTLQVVNTAVAQAPQVKSPKQPEVVMVHPGDSPPTFSRKSPTFSPKPTLRELIHHTVDTQISEMQKETSSGVTVVRPTMVASKVAPVAAPQVPMTVTIKQQVPVMVEEQSVDMDSKGDESDTMPFTDDQMQTVVVSDEIVQTSVSIEDVEIVNTEVVDVMAGGDGVMVSVSDEMTALTALPDQVMQEDEIAEPVVDSMIAPMEVTTTQEQDLIVIESPHKAELDTTTSMLEPSEPVMTKITVTNATPMPPTTVQLATQAKSMKSPPAKKPPLTPTTVITVISPPEKQKKKAIEVQPEVSRSPVKFPEIIKSAAVARPVSIAAGRERRTSKPTRYYGLDSDYEMDQPNIYRSYGKDSESGEDKASRKKTESHDDSQSSDLQSGDEEPLQRKKGRGRPRKSDTIPFVKVIPKPTPEDSNDQSKAVPVQVLHTQKTVVDSSEEKSSVDDKSDTSPKKRGRGRPKRTIDVHTSQDDNIDTDSDSKVTRQAQVVYFGAAEAKRGRGRPPKSTINPNVVVLSPAKSPKSTSDQTKPRKSDDAPKEPMVIEMDATETMDRTSKDAPIPEIAEKVAPQEVALATDIKQASASEEQTDQVMIKDGEICTPVTQTIEIAEEVMHIDGALELNAITGEMEKKPQSTPLDDLAKDPISDLLSTNIANAASAADQNDLDDSFNSSTGSGGVIVSKFNDDDDDEGFLGTEVIVKQSPFKDKDKKSTKSEESYTKRRSGRPKGPVSYLEQLEDDKPSKKTQKKEPPEEKREWLTSEVEALKQEISDLKFLNESLQNRLGQESGSPEEVRTLQSRIDKLQTTNNELRSKLKDSELTEKKVGINLKQGMKFSFHKGPSVTSTAQSQPNVTKSGVDKNIVKQREIDLAEQEVRARETGLDRREMKLRALDRELDERTAQLTKRESKLDRWERKLKSQEKEIEYKEKQMKRFENDFRELGGSGSTKRQKLVDTEGDISGKLSILEEAQEDIEKKESDIAVREKMLQAAQAELDKLHMDLNKKAEYLESMKQFQSEEDDTSDEKTSKTEVSSRKKSLLRQSSSTPSSSSKLKSSKSSSDQRQSSSGSKGPKSPRTRTPSRKVLEQVQDSTPASPKRKRQEDLASTPVPVKKSKDDDAKTEDAKLKTPKTAADDKTSATKKEDSDVKSGDLKSKTPKPAAKDKTSATKKEDSDVKSGDLKSKTPKPAAKDKTSATKNEDSDVKSGDLKSKTPKPAAKDKTPAVKTPVAKVTAKVAAKTTPKTNKTPAKTPTTKTPASTKKVNKTPASSKSTPNARANKKTTPKSTPKAAPTSGKTPKTPKSGDSKTPKAASLKKTPKSSSRTSTPSLKSPVAKVKSTTPAAKKSPASANLKRKRTSDASVPSKTRRK